MTNQGLNYYTSPQVAIVSGGSKGLGEGFVKGLLAAGWSVATFARQETDFSRAASADPNLAGRFMFRLLDVRDSEGTEQLVKEVVERWGKLDLLVNNAAVAELSWSAVVPDNIIDEQISVNLSGVLKFTRAGAMQMMRQRWGRIINISSVTARKGFGGMGPYASTKAAMDGLTRTLAIELGSSNVTVNAIAPGYIPTDMTKRFPPEILDWNRDTSALKRLGTVDDFVGPFMFLVSDAARFITGQVIVVDGGLTI